MVTTDPLLTTILNLTAFHREHEKYYGVAPREQAVVLQRHSRTLLALADRWTTAHPPDVTAASPFAGAPDLNAREAIQLDGVLFMEGEGEPGEITHLKRDLRTHADDAADVEDLDGARTSAERVRAARARQRASWRVFRGRVVELVGDPGHGGEP